MCDCQISKRETDMSWQKDGKALRRKQNKGMKGHGLQGATFNFFLFSLLLVWSCSKFILKLSKTWANHCISPAMCWEIRACVPWFQHVPCCLPNMVDRGCLHRRTGRLDTHGLIQHWLTPGPGLILNNVLGWGIFFFLSLGKLLTPELFTFVF